jgi:hypothetical protein
LPGCSADSGERRSITDIVKDGIERAKERRGDNSGNTAGERDAGVSIGTDGRRSFDYVQ